MRDLDSDNDGLLDANESDHIDENNDGIIDTAASIRRTLLAVDEFGLAPDAGGLPRNSDNDGLADFRDGDCDNDGIMDIVESFGAIDVDNNGILDDFVDLNKDGVDDNWLANLTPPRDTDADNFVDAIEIDSDADGLTDIIESGGIDEDGDGTIDGFIDSNNDGIDDTVAVVPTIIIDSDNDGTPDYQDTDSDNDGVTDLVEAGGTDLDGDGRADALIVGSLPDADGDGTPDFLESDGADPMQQAGLQQQPEPATGAASGIIRTGLEGSGCAISPTLMTSGNTPPKIDPTLPVISILALAGLAIRRRTRIVTRKVVKGAGVAVVAIGSLFGCSTSGDLLEDADYEDKLSRGIYAVAGIGPSRLEPDTSQVQGVDPNDRVEPAGQIAVGVDLTMPVAIGIVSGVRV